MTRVFVVGTGRCGTTAFARACEHITNYTVAHESHAGVVGWERLCYPDRWIEVDPHLAWTLPLIMERYPLALYVHLWRPESDVVASWLRRGIDPHGGPAPLIDVMFQTRCVGLSESDYEVALRVLYRSVMRQIEFNLEHEGVRSVRYAIHHADEWWPSFCWLIGAEGDLEAGRAEFERRHNATAP
jgi:hypothetical protein